MKRKELLTDISKTIEFLEEIQKVENAVISSNEFSTDYKIELFKANNGQRFTLFHDSFFFMHDKWDFKDLEIITDKTRIRVPYLFINQKTGGSVSGEIPSFEIGEFNNDKQTYHRLALPVNKKLNFIFSIENVLIDYKYKSGISTREATEIIIENNNFYLFFAKSKLTESSDQDYLIIESQSPSTYSEFSEYCFSILICFGYISGDFINDDGYFFQYSEKEMIRVIGLAYRQLRGTIECQYVPIYSNPYGYIHNPEISNLYKNKVRPLSLKEFSQLCQLCHTNGDIKSILLLLIEVQTQSLISGPGILSIALETLANIIYEENEAKLSPIKSKGVSKKIRKELLKVLDIFSNDIDNEGFEILKTRISQINQRTNRDKLLIPFKILNIPITDSDIEAIEQRNAFLHGRTPMVQDNEPKTINEADKFRYYLYLKIYVLVSSVILKYIGYDNYVINYPKIHEASTGIKLNEEHYRKI